jgi:tRNA threonylcarbamoyladenosine modification (KEOPS) complex Cgi121 subunit/molybdopterin converting factor small subunit
MILVKLLGGAKKAVGRDQLEIDAKAMSVIDILDVLRSRAEAPQLLKRENLIIAINGADSKAFGESPIVNDGDVLTIVTVVHGGAPQETAPTQIIEKINGKFVLVAEIKKVTGKDPAEFLRKLRAQTDADVQIVNSDSVYSLGHILGVVTIAVEAQEQGCAIASSLEVEILVRLAATNQISIAIQRCGVQYGNPACIIALNESKDVISKFCEKVSEQFELDSSLYKQNKSKARRILRSMGLTKAISAIQHKNIEPFLIERAAITIK